MQKRNKKQFNKVFFVIDTEFVQEFAEENFQRRLTRTEMETIQDIFSDKVCFYGDVCDSINKAIKQAIRK